MQCTYGNGWLLLKAPRFKDEAVELCLSWMGLGFEGRFVCKSVFLTPTVAFPYVWAFAGSFLDRKMPFNSYLSQEALFFAITSNLSSQALSFEKPFIFPSNSFQQASHGNSLETIVFPWNTALQIKFFYFF